HQGHLNRVVLGGVDRRDRDTRQGRGRGDLTGRLEEIATRRTGFRLNLRLRLRSGSRLGHEGGSSVGVANRLGNEVEGSAHGGTRGNPSSIFAPRDRLKALHAPSGGGSPSTREAYWPPARVDPTSVASMYHIGK